MGKQDVVRKEGLVLEALPGVTFRVRCDDGTEILAHLSGKMRKYRIRIVMGDQVTLELAAPDSSRGRIVYRR